MCGKRMLVHQAFKQQLGGRVCTAVKEIILEGKGIGKGQHGADGGH